MVFNVFSHTSGSMDGNVGPYGWSTNLVQFAPNKNTLLDRITLNFVQTIMANGGWIQMNVVTSWFGHYHQVLAKTPGNLMTLPSASAVNCTN